MGFSNIITHAVLFLGAVIISYGFVSVMGQSGSDLTSSMDSRADVMAEKLKTDVTIVHVDTSTDTKVYVINTGKTVLEPGDASLFIDGTWSQISSTQIVNRSTNIDNGLWDPSEVLEMTYTGTVGAGRHTAKVAVRGGVTDELEFDK
jgi:archaellum component FlaG (FlaF/FlaG flagellin family)